MMTHPIYSEDCAHMDHDEAKALADKLVDWRLGHHLEAASKIIAASIYALSRSLDNLALRHERLTDAQARSNQIQERLVQLQEENLAMGARMREMADALIRGPLTQAERAGEGERKPPGWVSEMIEASETIEKRD